MSHDVIKDRYGRLYHLPNELSLLGHEVICRCLDYHTHHSLHERHRASSEQHGELSWTSTNAGPLGLKIPLYIFKLFKEIRAIQPDVIIGSSDVLHVIVTRILANISHTPYFLDLYDNYESFGMGKIPGIGRAYRSALQRAATIFTVSRTLQRHISNLAPDIPVTTLESTIATDSFLPMSKRGSRRTLNLPIDKPLIGTAGSLATNRGTEHLYTAFWEIKKNNPDACLVLAGPEADNPPPRHADVFYLGMLQHDTVPTLFNALDVAIICMKDDEFGKYAFPQKAYEILACKTPLVCASVGAMKDLLGDYPECLYYPDDARNMAARINEQLQKGICPAIPIPTWRDQAVRMAQCMASIMN